MTDVMTAQKVAARTEDAVKVYGKGQTEVRALDGVTVEFAARPRQGGGERAGQQHEP